MGAKSPDTSMTSFTTTLKSFCDELALTFPELKPTIARAVSTTPALYWRSWVGSLDILLSKDASKLFEARKGFVVGAVRLTPQDWIEISEKTQAAVWKYLRTLVLEAAMEQNMEGVETETMQKLMDIMAAEKLDADPLGAASEMFEDSMGHLKPLMEKLKGMMGSSGFMDASGFADFKMPEIPERLRKGHIAKMAEDMAKQFDPKEFGIDPALLSGDNVEEIMKRLAEIYQKDPTQLIAGAKRMAEKIKRQITGGSSKREDLLAEAQEFVAPFKEHPMFKEIMGKVSGLGNLSEMFGGGATSEPSDRRRAVQERLRKKMAARNGSGGK